MEELIVEKEFYEFKSIDQNYYCSIVNDVNVNKYKAKYGTVLRFWKNKGWINSIYPYDWFEWYFSHWLGRRSLDDERQIARWKKILSIFKGELVKMIKAVNGRFDYYSISPKIRQVLLH